MVVIPRTAAPVTGMGFGLALREGGAEAGQGALTEVRQTLAWNVFAPAGDRFQMSKPLLAGLFTAT